MRFVRLLLLTSLLWSSCAAAAQHLSYRGWKRVFFDDFDTYRDVPDMAARGPWKFRPDTYRTLVGNAIEDQYYDSTGVELHDGDLHLVARPMSEPLLYHFQLAGRDTAKLLHYRSGWISLKDDFPTSPALGDTAKWPGNLGFQYGLFEIRCKLSAGAGLWPAFWLFSGPTEIDIFEGGAPRKSSNNVHFTPQDSTQRRYQQQLYDYQGPVDLVQDFHTYSAVWTPTEVSFYLDRRLLRTVPASQVPTAAAPAVLIANQAVANSADPRTWLGVPGQPHASFIIDYIKVYKPRAAAPARNKPR